MQYGLIGKTLAHSYSKQIHNAISNYDYTLTPLATQDEFEIFMKSANFKGINVTIPYKQSVMPYCFFLDERAKKVGSVNTIVNKNGKLAGYNTDYDGFKYMANRANITFNGKNVMILGTGGTSLTAIAVASDSGAKSIKIVSRNAKNSDNNSKKSTQDFSCTVEYLTYEEARNVSDTEVLINTTPVGMYPHNDSTPIDLLSKNGEHYTLPNLVSVIDVIYNPAKTQLLADAKKRGLMCTGGLSMLVAQAKFAAEIFTDNKINDEIIEYITAKMHAEMTNIVLIGMPGCGKSHIGKKLAKLLNRDFADLDNEIVKRENCSIEHMFKTKGEGYFREVESEVCEQFAKRSSLVISTGGGIVLNKYNTERLRRNSTVFFIDRSLKLLQTGCGRPLSKSTEDVKRLYDTRYCKYVDASDFAVKNDGNIDDTVGQIKEVFYGNTSD